MADNKKIKIDIISYENNNCARWEVGGLLEIFKRKFISWVSSPSKGYLYGLDDIAFSLSRLGYMLTIEREPVKETNKISGTENCDYYLGIFESYENDRTLIIKAVLSYL
jgi:hypothetical protein